MREAAEDWSAVANNIPSSRALGKILEASGIQRPEGYEAHHIVAGLKKLADPARRILKHFGININAAANGVFLPATEDTVNIGGEAVHRPLHTKEYIEAVNEALKKATTRQDAINILQSIGRALQSGGYP